MIDMMVWWWYD